MWDDQTWAMFCALMHRGWPGAFTEEDALAYRVLLDGVDPAEAVGALRRLLHRGARFRPSAAELLGELHADPTRPTFAEAYQLIFGPRGVLRARIVGGRWDNEADRRAAHRQAIEERAAGVHPLVGAFVMRQGIDRLRTLPLEDPQWGEKHRRDLERAWEQHVEAFDGREVAALAAGSRDGLRQLDPLAALGIARPKPDAPALEERHAA
jgi:hypothetical protein